MRALMAFVLLLRSSWAAAAVYTWSCPGSVAVVTKSGSCNAIAGAWADRLAYVGYRPDTGDYGASVAYTEAGCSAPAAVQATDVLTVTLSYLVGGASPVSGTTTAACTLSSVSEDDVLGDVDGMPLQRVLVMVGCSLMFGLGFVGGKA